MKKNFLKKVSLLLLFSIGFCSIGFCQVRIKITYCYKGEWSSWESFDTYISRNNDGSMYELKTPGGRTFFAFYMNNFLPPTRREIIARQESDTWYVYNGSVEYYVNDRYPTAETLAKACTLVQPNPRKDVTPNVQRTCSATIKVQPYKKTPEVFNIWFDNIGIGVDISNIIFK